MDNSLIIDIYSSQLFSNFDLSQNQNWGGCHDGQNSFVKKLN